ncbi:SAM-dependent methyltransferase [Thermodesulfobacteriota bacterium]
MKTSNNRSMVETPAVVVHCYDFFDRVFPECGFFDLTEGIYNGDSSTSYEQAQKNQANWILDEAHCRKGLRILDIGCGYGTLLATAQRRGAEAIGITISPPQLQHCKNRGLNVRLLDYREIDEEWTGYFDAIIANGSIEHFVQPRDVLEGLADTVYQELFRICHRIINPGSSVRRLVTTTIHSYGYSPEISPGELTKGPFAFRLFSDKFHYALLQKGFGGFYPAIGQLKRCADPLFKIVKEVDGTHDYHLTSEKCFKRAKHSLFQWKTGPRIWKKLCPLFFRHPLQVTILCFGLLVAESWQWQFRGKNPPTKLLRQTWNYQEL